MGVFSGDKFNSREFLLLQLGIAAYSCLFAAAAVKLQHIWYLYGQWRRGDIFPGTYKSNVSPTTMVVQQAYHLRLHTIFGEKESSLVDKIIE